ncbi:MAG: response regulator, partial [Bacteroidota bacterium]
SEGMYAIFGVDVNRKPVMDLFYTLLHPDDKSAVEEAVTAMKPDDPPWTIRYRIILPSDEIRHIEAHSKIVIDPETNTPVLVGSCQDVTEREILLSSLRQKEAELQESLKTKETFLANISHELRTPLNGILGIVRLLRKTQLNGIQREYIEVMNETAGNLLVIINDLLDFARWQSGELTFEESVFDPVKVADSSLQLQVFRAQEKGLSIKHLWEGGIPAPLVIGDPHRLSQILLNLLSNAVKFTEQGNVVLNQTLLSEDAESVLMQFRVSDTGIGIPEHMHKRIFESFTQVNSSEFGTGGLGLGLAISKSLVEKQGGSIRVESSPDKGSTFIFELRYPKAGKRSTRATKPSAGKTDPSTIRVLVVDDNKVNLFVTEAMLKGWHMQVKSAMSGQEAIDQLHQSDFDIILMDIQMPGMDGIEATRRIRSMTDLKKSQVPILAVTANTSRTTRRKCIAGGMNDCLVKPFKDDNLFKKIMSCLDPGVKAGLSRPARRMPLEVKSAAVSTTLYELLGLSYETDSNRDFLIRMLSIFNETVPSAVDAMMAHYSSGDLKSVSELAHKIRPTLVGSGILAVKETIRNIEHHTERKRSNNELRADLEQLNVVVREVSRQFSQEMERLLKQKVS